MLAGVGHEQRVDPGRVDAGAAAASTGRAATAHGVGDVPGSGYARRSSGGASRVRRPRGQQPGHGLDRQPVAEAAEAGDGPVGHGGHHRGVAPRLARRGVREVELDDDPVESRQGVVQGPGVVREGAGVDDRWRRRAPGAVDQLDELALVVGLVVLELEPAPASASSVAAATWSASVAVP